MKKSLYHALAFMQMMEMSKASEFGPTLARVDARPFTQRIKRQLQIDEEEKYNSNKGQTQGPQSQTKRAQRKKKMKIHELKSDPDIFQMTYDSRKNFEIRPNDRIFCMGDILHLRETVYSSEQMSHQGSNNKALYYSGREMLCLVKSVLHGPCYGPSDGFVAMSIEVLHIA